MAVYNPIKVTSLPATPAENSVYYVKGASDTRIRLFVTDNSGTAFPVGYVDDDAILSVPLTGYSVGSNTALAGTDSILLAFGKVQGQLNNLSTAVADGIKVPIPIDCSGNPNYPIALKGDSYIVTNGGRIGGASGSQVRTGDKIVALEDNAGGTQAAVGSSWFIMEGNRQDATESVTGFTRIATESEANTGTESFAYVTPLRLRGGVRATTLTGYTVGSNTALSDTDSILQAFGKIQGQINARLTTAVTSFSGGTTGLTPSSATTGAVTLGGILNLANGGTGSGTASGARTNLGATTLGGNLFTIANPSAVTFPRFNANNTVSALSASDFITAIGAQATLTNPVTGTGVSGRVAFWNETGSITSDGGFNYEANGLLTISNRVSPTYAILSTRTSANTGRIGTIEWTNGSNDLRAVIAVRNESNNGGSLIFETALNNIVDERWRILPEGILQSNGAQTIQTSTGNLTLATGGGNGNILLSPNGSGNLILNAPGNPVFQVQESGVLRARLGDIGGTNDGVLSLYDSSSVQTIRLRGGLTSYILNDLRIGTTSDLSGGGRLQVSGGINVSSIGNATGDFVTHSGGLLTKRTPAQVRTEIVTWTEVGW